MLSRYPIGHPDPAQLGAEEGKLVDLHLLHFDPLEVELRRVHPGVVSSLLGSRFSSQSSISGIN